MTDDKSLKEFLLEYHHLKQTANEDDTDVDAEQIHDAEAMDRTRQDCDNISNTQQDCDQMDDMEQNCETEENFNEKDNNNKPLFVRHTVEVCEQYRFSVKHVCSLFKQLILNFIRLAE